jgi:antirestriction protein ArdC
MSVTSPQPLTEPAAGPPVRDFRQEVTNNIIRLLEQGAAPWQKPWESGASLGMPMNPTTGKSYRGGNAIHLMTSGMRKGYDDPRWMTYRQASEHGWQVRKGEKGTQIEFWEIRTNPQKTRDKDDPALKEHDSDSDTRRLIHRIYTVFNAKQMDGIPPHVAKQHSRFEAVQAGEQILQNSGAPLRFSNLRRSESIAILARTVLG